MTSFSDRLYAIYRKAPVWCDVENQWAEHGWFHDAEEDLLVEYEIDRKAQSHTVLRTRTREAFEADILPKAKSSLKKWYAGL